MAIESKILGDDLRQARQFVSQSLSDMRLLLSDIRLDRDASEPVLIRIQKQAKQMHCLAIYRAAQTVLNAYNDHHNQERIDGRLIGLNKLVTQYSMGLDEILPAPANLSNTESDSGTGETDKAHTIEPSAEIIEIPAEIQARFDAARATLGSLLPKAGSQLSQLQKLHDAAWHGQTATNSLSAVDADMENILLLNEEAIPLVLFESLMSDISQGALSIARQQGKSVSLSYATMPVSLEFRQAERAVDTTLSLIEWIISHTLENTSQRLSKGLSRSGFIDLNATSSRDGDLSLSLNFVGTMPADNILPDDVSCIDAGDGQCELTWTIAVKAPRRIRKTSVDSRPATYQTSEPEQFEDMMIALEIGA